MASVVSFLNLGSICYAIRVLSFDKLLACVRYGVLTLGTKSVFCKAVIATMRVLRSVVVCLFDHLVLWLARLNSFDYTYYIRTKLAFVKLLFARRALTVLGSVLFLGFVCSGFRLLVSSAFCARFRYAFSYVSLLFVRKMMWNVSVCRPYLLVSRRVGVLTTLFGVCLFVLGVSASRFLINRGALKIRASVQFINNVCKTLGLRVRKLLFNVWSLRTRKPNVLQTFSSSWICAKISALRCMFALRTLGTHRLVQLRGLYASVYKRVSNLLCAHVVKNLLLEVSGVWRVLSARLFHALGLIAKLFDIRVLLEWCNLVVMCCCSVLYCISFYKILASGDRVFVVSAFLDILKALRTRLISLLSTAI
ncbi:hypothetical protein AADW59_00095 [Candidatus Hodgkinia cicadicola]